MLRKLAIPLSIYFFAAGSLSANGYFWPYMGALVLGAFWLSFALNLFMSWRETGKGTALSEISITIGIQAVPFIFAKMKLLGFGLDHSLFPLLWLRPYPIVWTAILHGVIVTALAWWYIPKKRREQIMVRGKHNPLTEIGTESL